MKNILQKLYYYSPYIPIIGMFIAIKHDIKHANNYELVIYNISDKWFDFWIKFQFFTTIILIILIGIFILHKLIF